jgi:DNA-binding GntR family transcriptional regulator
MARQANPAADFQRPQLLSEHVYEQLKGLIISNQIQPGAPLGEERLATQWGISRTPLRTALARLERDGLVRMVPHRGCVAADIRPQDVRDTYQAREALEVAIIEQTTPHIPEEKLSEIARLFASIDADLDQGQYDSYIPSDAFFHAVLLEYATNMVLIRMLGQLYEQITRIRNYSHGQPGEHMREAHSEHRRILEALQRRDAEAASAAMRDHLRNVTRRAIALLPDSNDGSTESASDGAR